MVLYKAFRPKRVDDCIRVLVLHEQVAAICKRSRYRSLVAKGRRGGEKRKRMKKKIEKGEGERTRERGNVGERISQGTIFSRKPVTRLSLPILIRARDSHG